MKVIRLVVLTLVLVACTDESLNRYNQALDYLGQRDYASATQIFVSLAENGYAPAQFRLGLSYLYGKGVKENGRQAAFWFQKGAQQDHLGSQYSLGLLYLKGIGVPQSDALALQRFQQLGEQGFVPAQYQFAQMIEQGQGAAADPDLALHWYQQAGEAQHEKAILRLVRAYEKGELGLAQNAEQAHQWRERMQHKAF